MTDSALYSTRLLGLATSLSDFPFSGVRPLVHEARSKTCGSIVRLELATNPSGEITEIGLKVQACAVGQAACTIMAEGAIGRSLTDCHTALKEIQSWLKGGDQMPEWPDFDSLQGVQPHKGRHGALLLPWQAAAGALSIAATPS